MKVAYICLLFAFVTQLELPALGKKCTESCIIQQGDKSQAQVQWSITNGEDAPFHCSAREQYEIRVTENIFVIRIT